jgi:hypothetical protein
MVYREDLIVTLTVVENKDQAAGERPGRLARVFTWLGLHKITAVMVAAALAVIVMVIAGGSSAPVDATTVAPATQAAPTAPVIAEDSPAWDCRTMGNGLCGPGNANGATPGYYRGGKLYADWEHAQWMAYGMQVAITAGGSQAPAQPTAQTVSDNGSDGSDATPVYPVVVADGPQHYDATGDPRSESAQQPRTQPQAQPQAVVQPQAQAEPQAQSVVAPQAQPQASGSGSVQLDPAMISQLMQMAQGASSGDSVDTGQLAGLLSQLDPDTLKALLPLARQACQVIG